MILCWSCKGGSGTTVVAATIALLLAAERPTTLVDFAGDAPAVLGLPEPTSPGVVDWAASKVPTPLTSLEVPVKELLTLVPRGLGVAAPFDWPTITEHLVSDLSTVVVDLGVGAPDPALRAAADQSILVIRPCYLALRRAVHVQPAPTDVVVVTEPGRALTARDVERSIGAPVLAEIPFDPTIARAVDAGLLAARLPRSLSHALRHVS